MRLCIRRAAGASIGKHADGVSCTYSEKDIGAHRISYTTLRQRVKQFMVQAPLDAAWRHYVLGARSSVCASWKFVTIIFYKLSGAQFHQTHHFGVFEDKYYVIGFRDQTVKDQDCPDQTWLSKAEVCASTASRQVLSGFSAVLGVVILSVRPSVTRVL